MRKYEYIIWDWNGTLFNDVPVCIKTMNTILAKRNMPEITKDHYLSIFDFPVRNYYVKLGFDFSVEPFEKISEEFIALYKTEFRKAPLFDDTVDILERFEKSGLSQLIISASHNNDLEDQVGHFGINHFFSNLLGLDTIHASGKVEIGTRWARESGLEKEKMIVIGDTVHDYKVAQSIGCDCILVANGHQNRERLECAGVPVINALTELTGIML
ncbi:MAG: HAD family hydrolase [Bacillota bacterium]|nr:HAD family hydrolase [Bacillota bacterium]